MRVIDHALVPGMDGEASTVTLAVTVPWFRGQPVYHVFHRDAGVLAFHRSYTKADVIGWPNQRRPGKYRHPQPAIAAMEDFRVTVDALRAAAGPAMDSESSPTVPTASPATAPPTDEWLGSSAVPPHRSRGSSVA